MNDEQKYLFDLKGYIVCKNVVPIEIIDSTRKLIDQLLEMDPKDHTPPVRRLSENVETENPNAKHPSSSSQSNKGKTALVNVETIISL